MVEDNPKLTAEELDEVVSLSDEVEIAEAILAAKRAKINLRMIELCQKYNRRASLHGIDLTLGEIKPR